MKKKLTIILLTSNENNDNTLKSISDLDYDLVVVNKEDVYNLYKHLNGIETNDWILLLYQNETVNDCSRIAWAIDSTSKVYKLMILNNGIVSKENRLWHKSTNLKFTNNLYPFVDSKGELIDCVINSGDYNPYTEDHIKRWIKDDPTSSNPYYYAAFWYLAKNNRNQFIVNANNYLLRNNKAITTTIMMKYYYSIINLYNDNAGESIKQILGCLAIKPLMAEFWCMLGDIYYFNLKQYSHAKMFYDNAIFLGSKRKFDDEYPIDISKYDKYPNKMILQCNNIKNNSKIYSIQ